MRTGLCAGCQEAAKLEGDQAVGGSEITRLREAAGLTLEQLAALVNTERNAFRLDAADLDKLEHSLIHASFLHDVERLIKEGNKDMTDKTDEVKATEQVAREALGEYQEANAEAESLRAAFMEALDTLMNTGSPLRDALSKRYTRYLEAVRQERRRAAVAGEQSREGDIEIVPFRPVLRLPAGCVQNIELWAESAVYAPAEPDPAAMIRPSDFIEYLDTGNDPAGVPISPKARRAQARG